MSLPDSSPPCPQRRLLRDFIRRRDPRALRVLLLTAAIFAFESFLLFRWSDPSGPRFPNFLLIPWLVTLTALLAAPWWTQPSAPAYPGARWMVAPAARKAVWLMAAAVAVLALWPRSVRLDHSLSRNEIANLDTAYRHAREFPVVNPDDKMEPAGAKRLVWDHVTAQFAVELFMQNPRHAGRVDGRRARALPWVAGLLTVGAVVLLAAAMGSPRAGLAAGLIMAMHPQHVRWSTEVVDDSIVMLGFAAALLCLFQILLTNRWRWWLALGVVQGCSVVGMTPGIINVPLVSLAAAVAIAASRTTRGDRASAILRLGVPLAIAGLGMVIPFSYVIDGFDPPLPKSDVWGRLFAGVPWAGDGSGAGLSLAGVSGDTLWRGAVFYGILPLLLAAGLYFMFRQDWRTRMVGSLALAGMGFALAGSLHGSGLLSFTLVLFPLVLVWAGVGLHRQFPRHVRLAHAPLFIAVLYVLSTSPFLNRMMQVPLDPLRDVAAAARPEKNAASAAAPGPVMNAARVYDPDVRLVESAAELNALADAAFENDQPLYVYEPLKADETGEAEGMHRELATGGRFEPVREFHGMDARTSYRLYRYQSREQIIRLNVKPEGK